MAGLIPESIFEGTNFSESLRKIVRMSLEDGMLTAREKELIKRKALADGIDEIEFEFYFEKIEERFNSILNDKHNPVQGLKKAFDIMKEMAEGGGGVMPSELAGQLSQIPGIGAGAAIVGAVSSVLNLFIKTPSNLNNLKAEVIKHVVIPNNITLIVEFLEYANISIAEEKQRIKAKSVASGISNAIAGAELDIIPIWQLKKKQVIQKAIEDFRDNPEALNRLKKYQVTPTEKLKKLLASTAGLPVKMSSIFMKVGVPDTKEDLLDLMSFVRQTAQSSDPRAHDFMEFLSLLQIEGGRKFPDSVAEIESHSVRIAPLQKLKEQLKNGNTRGVLAETVFPDDKDEFFDMIRFVEAQSRANNNEATEFKQFLWKMYEFGLVHFPDNKLELSSYRPHSVDLLKHQLTTINKNCESGGFVDMFKELLSDSSEYKNAVERVLLNFPTPRDYDDLVELLSFVTGLVSNNKKANVSFMEFQNRLYEDGLRSYPEMSGHLRPYRISAREKFKLYAKTHSLSDAIASFATPVDEEDFFDLIQYAQQLMKSDDFHKDLYKQLQKRLYMDGKMMDINQERLKQYKVKSFRIF